MPLSQPTDSSFDARSPAPVWSTNELKQLDQAVDYAARVSHAAVGEFLAAPADITGPACPAIEIAVEFFVPPTSAEQFADELERAMVRRSLHYSAARRSGLAGPLQLQVLPAGAFHQWRKAWTIDATAQHNRRWAADRQLLDGILRQARIGWREFYPVG
jgi:hypothetical protein